jgi:formate hydrogenlyase subunit 3/multisubunit Na+/H+ antiporter MnhD subunit
MDTVLIPLFLCIALGVGLYAWAIPQGGPRWWGFAAATVALVVVSRLAGPSGTASVLADLAELVAVGLIWSQGTPQAEAAARKYLTAIALGIVLTRLSGALIGAGAATPDGPAGKIAVALLIVGFALKLALVPVYSWLPAVARAASAMTTALIIGVIDVSSFCDLITLRTAAPWVFENFSAVWIAVAVVSLIGAALLALAQTELKPMLAFSSIDDIGYLLLGLVLGGPNGMTGAWFGILSHGIAKVVLFGSVGAAEWYLGRPVSLNTRGLASRLPVASAAFMLGALGFIGIPPTLGFVGHWRLYLAGAELGGPLLVAVLCAASAMAVLCYARAIHRTWLGPADIADTGRSLPVTGAVVLLTFALASVFFGFVPDVLRTAPPPTHALASLVRSTP